MLPRFILTALLILPTACASNMNTDSNTDNTSPSPDSEVPPAIEKSTSLQWLLPKPSIDFTETTLIMYGSDDCIVSSSSKDSFLQDYDLEVSTRFEYRDRSVLSEQAQYYGTPSFVLFHEGVPIDFHIGIVSAANDFAHAANSRIFNLLLTRNNIIEGDKWKNSNNQHGEFEHGTHLDYMIFSFQNFEEFDFSRRSLKYTIFSSALLREANFADADLQGTVFAHSDLTGVLFSKAQQAESFIIGGICPDGTEASIGMNCEGRFLPVEAEE